MMMQSAPAAPVAKPPATVEAASAADIDDAVAAARAAFEGAWGRINGSDRATVMFRFADEAYIDVGGEQGARLANAYRPWEGAGHFVRPAIFADVRADMRIAREEIVGPVLSCIARRVDSAQGGIIVQAAVSRETPFGCNRRSGWGREFGEQGFARCLQTKAITIDLGPRSPIDGAA